MREIAVGVSIHRAGCYGGGAEARERAALLRRFPHRQITACCDWASDKSSRLAGAQITESKAGRSEAVAAEGRSHGVVACRRQAGETIVSRSTGGHRPALRSTQCHCHPVECHTRERHLAGYLVGGGGCNKSRRLT